MAKGKKTFIFYSDWINIIREMDNEDAGELLKHILSYVNDEEPTTKNKFVRMAFGHMKPLIKQDLVKWDEIREKRKQAGSKGGKQTQANAKQMIEVAKQVQAVNVNVNVNDNEIIDKSITINNKKFISKAINDNQWLEVLAIQNKFKIELVKNKIDIFENHLLSTKKQHSNYKDFASHFSYWLKQNKNNNNKAQKITF